VKEVDDQTALDKAKNWLEAELAGMTTYYYHDGTASCPREDEDPYRSGTIHEVSIVDCEIEEKLPDSIVVKLEAILWKSDDEGKGEGEIYDRDATYHIRVWDGGIELQAID
jgi:hypothetical protein